MIIRFGYVANALSIWDSSPSKTMTFSRWSSLPAIEREKKLIAITKQNLKNTCRALHYNIAHEFPLYRMSSSMIPLATHPDVQWDYLTPFRKELSQIGELVKKHKLRVSFHPNQFTLFTSEEARITNNAITDMSYHYSLLEAMGIQDHSYINIHVGGAYGNKEKALGRFHENIKVLPQKIKRQMTLENDDKTYNAEETLSICQKENIPFVFDYHHHLANASSTSLERLLPKIFSTWEQTGLQPKVHFSSPKTNEQYRSHHDYVDVSYTLPFIKLARKIGQDFDVMIEAKQKDKALICFLDELSSLRGFNRLAGGIIEVK